MMQGVFTPLKGKVFGRLLVERRSYEMNKSGHVNWICTCECGNETVVSSRNLTKGVTRSCGCLFKEAMKAQGARRAAEAAERRGGQPRLVPHLNIINLAGKRFGRLVVLELMHETTPQRRRRWLTVCDCGKHKIAISTELIRRRVTSCGCFQKERMRELGRYRRQRNAQANGQSA